MRKKVNYIRYEEILTDNEILLYSQMINQFKKGEINYKTLKSMFLTNGVNIEVIPRNIERIYRITDANAVKERILNQDYIYSDINCFILNSDEFKNIIFCLDYKAIEVMANYGIPEYQQTMISILNFQLKNSFDKNELFAAKRRKWKTRVKELTSQLEVNNNLRK